MQSEVSDKWKLTVPFCARNDIDWSMPPPSVPMYRSQCWQISASSNYNALSVVINSQHITSIIKQLLYSVQQSIITHMIWHSCCQITYNSKISYFWYLTEGNTKMLSLWFCSLQILLKKFTLIKLVIFCFNWFLKIILFQFCLVLLCINQFSAV